VSTDGFNYKCDCKQGFSGFICEKKSTLIANNNAARMDKDVCFSQPCFNDGKCILTDETHDTRFKCDCKPGFYGTYCEADLRRCNSSPCQKNCDCIEIAQNMSFECKCNEKKDINEYHETKLPINEAKTKESYDPLELNFSSSYATHSIDKTNELTEFNSLINEQNKLLASKSNQLACTDFNPCKHGNCVLNNKTKEFACECFDGYLGPFCDIIKHTCDSKPCGTNGVCEIVSSTSYKCLCKPNFTGENCQTGLFTLNNFKKIQNKLLNYYTF